MSARVKSGLPAPCPFTSAIGGEADIIRAKADIPLPMSGVGGKADSLAYLSACLLLARSGSSHHRHCPSNPTAFWHIAMPVVGARPQHQEQTSPWNISRQRMSTDRVPQAILHTFQQPCCRLPFRQALWPNPVFLHSHLSSRNLLLSIL